MATILGQRTGKVTNEWRESLGVGAYRWRWPVHKTDHRGALRVSGRDAFRSQAQRLSTRTHSRDPFLRTLHPYSLELRVGNAPPWRSGDRDGERARILFGDQRRDR